MIKVKYGGIYIQSFSIQNIEWGILTFIVSLDNIESLTLVCVLDGEVDLSYYLKFCVL